MSPTYYIFFLTKQKCKSNKQLVMVLKLQKYHCSILISFSLDFKLQKLFVHFKIYYNSVNTTILCIILEKLLRQHVNNKIVYMCLEVLFS